MSIPSGFTITRHHDISCGHRVVGHENKCAHLHGHNYRFHFTVAPRPPHLKEVTSHSDNLHNIAVRAREGLDDVGRVLDFSAIKDRLCVWLETQWDHKMILWDQDVTARPLQEIAPNDIVLVPFNPTAENMARYMVTHVGPEVLPPHTQLIRCTIDETRKCSATYSI